MSSRKEWQPIRDLGDAIARIPPVEQIVASHQESGYEVTIVVNHATEEQRYTIYDAQWDLMGRYPHLGLDFHLLDRRGEPLSELLTPGPGDFVMCVRC